MTACAFRWYGIGAHAAAGCACGRYEYWGKRKDSARKDWRESHVERITAAQVGGTHNEK